RRRGSWRSTRERIRSDGGGEVMTKLAMAVLVGTLVSLLAGGPGAEAQQPFAALVLEATGVSRPAVQPYTEVPAGATVELSPGARLVLFHYYTCRALGLTGGKVVVNAEGLVPSGGGTARGAPPPLP